MKSLQEKKEKLNNSGFSLVEVLIAIAILAIISLPVLSTFSNSARINSKARRIENANTVIGNIVEEAKDMELQDLLDHKGKYYYGKTKTDNVYVVSDDRGAEGEDKTYFTGVDGEKYYVKATFDASAYTNPADASGSTDNSNNNINSSGLSMYADVTGGNNYVFRDDTGDEEALAYFRTFNTLASRADISKKTVVNINITDESDASTPNEVRLKQTMDITVTYSYNGNAYPAYVKTTTMSDYYFWATKELNGSDIVYKISGKLENNARNLYMFYTPFKGERVTTLPLPEGSTVANETDGSITTDTIEINYNIPSGTKSKLGLDVDYSDLNVYMLQQEKYVLTGSKAYTKTNVKVENIVIKQNGMVLTPAMTSSPVKVFSNVDKWSDKWTGLSDPTKIHNVLYRITVDVWKWKGGTAEYKDEDKITSLTTTKTD